jgi:hypothetical protein
MSSETGLCVEACNLFIVYGASFVILCPVEVGNNRCMSCLAMNRV